MTRKATRVLISLIRESLLKSKRSQVWIETVIYTLIALSIIGLLLTIIRPVIEAKQDRILIEGGLEALENIDNGIDEVKYYGVGNLRTVELKIKKGQLEINGIENKIVFSIESMEKYSEVGQAVNIGNIEGLTEEKNSKYVVSLALKYDNLNLTWQDKKTIQTLQPAPNPYIIEITNKGQTGELVRVDFS